MDDQVSALKECGIQAAKIHSDMTYDERSSSWNNFKNGKEKIIYLSPEKIMSEDFLNQLKNLDVGLFVIDEIQLEEDDPYPHGMSIKGNKMWISDANFGGKMHSNTLMGKPSFNTIDL